MSKPIIYDNGDIVLKKLTRIKFRSKLDNSILTGMIIGQESTQFIVWISSSVTAKIHTHDILEIEVISGNDVYFISLEEYKSIGKKQ